MEQTQSILDIMYKKGDFTDYCYSQAILLHQMLQVALALHSYPAKDRIVKEDQLPWSVHG